MRFKISEASKDGTLRRFNMLKHLRSTDNIPSDESAPFLTGIDMHDVIEHVRYALTDLGARTERSEDEQEKEELHQPDWNDPVACQLEELLTNNLLLVFGGAVKKIVESGYTEEVANWAVLKSGLFHSSKDAVSNVVDGALSLLKRENECGKSKSCVFEGMQSLVEYTILEMIHVLREVRPALTIAEAMWCLLISDLNLLNACGAPEDPSCQLEVLAESSTISQTEFEISDVSKLPNCRTGRGELKDTGKATLQGVQEKLSCITKEHIQILSQSTVADEKSGVCKKGSSASSKREMLRQRTFHLEKSYRGRMTKGAFKAKVAAWGNYVAEKSLLSQSASSSVVMTGTFSKLATPAGTNSDNCSISISCSRNLQSRGVSHVKDPVSELPAEKSESLKAESSRSDIPMVVDYFAGIPFDETLQKYTPQDTKDEVILILVPHKQELEKEIRRWMDWANGKVMQATRKLGEDKSELKKLRQENEEMEKLKKAGLTSEDNTVKRLYEMEHALSIHTGLIEVANSTVRRLEEDNSLLRKEIEVAKLQVLDSAAKLQEAVVREQEALRKSRSWDEEKGVFVEMQKNLKRQRAELENRKEKSKGRWDQLKVLWKHEEREKTRATTLIDSLRREKEGDDSLTKEEQKKIKKMAAENLHQCKEKIKILQSGISELRYESNKSKLAALSEGYGNSLAGSKIRKMFEDSFGRESVKAERECVMCMTDEISVIFLPCAHQVLCQDCSVLHQQQGMIECPSCRTVIEKRILVRYRVG